MAEDKKKGTESEAKPEAKKEDKAKAEVKKEELSPIEAKIDEMESELVELEPKLRSAGTVGKALFEAKKDFLKFLKSL
jgi:hypothetical protein